METIKINPIKIKVITGINPGVHEKRFEEFTHNKNIKIDSIESKVIYDTDDYSKQFVTFITYRVRGEYL